MKNLSTLLLEANAVKSELYKKVTDDVEQSLKRDKFFRNSLEEGKKKIETLQEKYIKVETLMRELTSCEAYASSLRAPLEELFELKKKLNYYKWWSTILTLSDDIQKVVEPKNIAFGSEHNALTGSLQSLQHFCNLLKLLQESNCTILRAFCQARLRFCLSKVHSKLLAELNGLFQLINWPSADVMGSPHIQSVLPQLVSLLHFGHHLYKSMGPAELEWLNESDPPADIHMLSPEGMVVRLLFVPVFKRFRFHFSGDHQTNRVDKPEWFMTFVVNILEKQRVFLNTALQSIFSDASAERVMSLAAAWLINECVKPKLKEELETYLSDLSLFRHAIAETLSFDQELAGSLRPYEVPLCVDVFCEDLAVFEKWIQLEQEATMSFYERCWNKKNKFDSNFEDLHEDGKVLDFASTFLSLLKSISERYLLLRNEERKLAFIKHVQMKILDRFLTDAEQILFGVAKDNGARFSQIQEFETFCKLISSLTFIRRAIWDWSNDLVYIDLHEALKTLAPRPPPSGAGSVFEGVVEKFEELEERGAQLVVDGVVETFCQDLEGYSRQRWVLVGPQGLALPVLSESLSGPFSVLGQQLLSTRSILPAALFETVWIKVAGSISLELLRRVVLTNYFNPNGCQRFCNDMKVTFEIFSNFSPYPERYLPEIADVCKIMTASQEQLEKIKTLESPSLQEDNKEVSDLLQNLNIHTLPLPTVVDLVSRLI
ncbi:RAD50-interacting protein 1-like isoform X2 [Zophobas morio]|uniref:RAD50-interacting protein 1-like isoform X2 n=1 Tax=Zophobas morio TaxID=2755281 RepID=UPI0030829656